MISLWWRLLLWSCGLQRLVVWRVDTNISEKPLFYFYFYSEDWSKLLIRNVNVGSVRTSVYKANVFVASFSSVIRTVQINLSCYATTLKCSYCNTSGLLDTLAGAALFPADARSMPCVINQIVTTSSRFAIVLNPLNVVLHPICHLLALLGAHHILHVSRIRVKLMAAEILPQCWEQTIIPRPQLLWYDQKYCILF